jgi:O-antigen/teichoic acid export membrane protein
MLELVPASHGNEMKRPGSRERLLNDSIISLGALGGSKVVMLVAGVVLARILGPEDLGIYTLLLAIGTLASSLSAFGVPQGTTKFLAEKNEEASTVPSNALFVLTILSLFACFLLLAGTTWIAEGIYKTPALAMYIPIVALFVLANNGNQLLMAILQGAGAIRWHNMFTVFTSLLCLGGIVVGASFAGLTGAMWANALYLFAAVSVISVVLSRLPDMPPMRLSIGTLSMPAFRRFFNYGMLLTAGGVFAHFAQWYAPTLLVKYHSYGALGLFRVANLLSSNLMMIPMAIAVPLFPSISFSHINDKTRFVSLAKDSFRLVTMTTLPLSLTLSLFSEEILGVLFGEEYAVGWQLLFLMSTAGFMMAINSNAGSLFFGSGDMASSLMLNGLWGIVFTLGAWLLIPKYGVVGFGFTYIASYAVLTGIQLLYQWFKWDVRFDNEVPLVVGIVVLFGIGYLLKLSLHGWLFYLVSALFILAVLVIEYRFLTPVERKYVIHKLNLDSVIKVPSA